MSFILEALRKSEAERRRGQTPDLLSDAVPIAPTARASTDYRGRIIAIVATLLIALLIVAWLLRPTTEPIERETAAVATGKTAVPTAAVAMPPLSKPASLSPPPTRAAPARAQQTMASAQATITTPDVASAQIPPPPSTTSTAEPRQISEPDAVAPPSPAPLATTEHAAAFASPDAPLKLADLPSEQRQQLPALKVSMHMWAPDSANRFAIIDGSRVNEGDRVGDAIVEAIQQDGIMLSWRGRRIRLPLR